MNRYVPQSQMQSNDVYFFVRNVQPPEFLMISLRGGQMSYAATTQLAQATTFNNQADLQKQYQALTMNKPEIIGQGFQGTMLSRADFLARTGNVQPRLL